MTAGGMRTDRIADALSISILLFSAFRTFEGILDRSEPWLGVPSLLMTKTSSPFR